MSKITGGKCARVFHNHIAMSEQFCTLAMFFVISSNPFHPTQLITFLLLIILNMEHHRQPQRMLKLVAKLFFHVFSVETCVEEEEVEKRRHFSKLSNSIQEWSQNFKPVSMWISKLGSRSSTPFPNILPSDISFRRKRQNLMSL